MNVLFKSILRFYYIVNFATNHVKTHGVRTAVFSRRIGSNNFLMMQGQ